MVKSYIKYEQSQSFGVINSGLSNLIHVRDAPGSSRSSAGHAVVGANEEVLYWDIKKGELQGRWREHNCKAEVTVLAQSHADRDLFAAGYADGSIRLWDARTSSAVIHFNGHRNAITQLTFDRDGVRLASGSKDTTIIIWDLVDEVGQFKFRGHTDQITGLRFIYPVSPSSQLAQGADDINGAASDGNTGFLLSTAKDSLLKLWDLSSQHCIETHIAQSNGECWSLDVSPDYSGCITGGNDGELKVWTIDTAHLQRVAASYEGNSKVIKERGTLTRHGHDRTTGVSFHPGADYIAVYGSEKLVEIWRVRTESEIRRGLARKRRRLREKGNPDGAKQASGEPLDGPAEDAPLELSAGIGDVFVQHVVVRTGGKVRSAAWMRSPGPKDLQVSISTTNNLLECYTVPTREKEKRDEEDSGYTRVYMIDLPGHRADIRSLALSSDDRMLASASNGNLKIWNVRTQTCLRTLDCGYALCCAFLPGDKIVVLGNKAGQLELFDIASSTPIDTVQAHEGAVWTLQVHPDGQSLVSGGADKSAKFWKFGIVNEEIPGTTRKTSRLVLNQTRTLKVSDDVLNLEFSPDSRLLAVATLDNTVKIFFVDSLKLFLNLYGHKLPVLSMSISSDSKMIATCSADKNIRLWGLDFGDCHKALFAHSDSIMQVSFIRHPIDREDAHTVFSCSKDRSLKSWDGDKFEQIQKLDGHQGEIWAMAVSRVGDFVVTASHDKSIRIWSQTDEPLFLEEEREREQEELNENMLMDTTEADAMALTADGRDGATSASKQTAATLTSGERIMDALETGFADLKLVQDWEHRKSGANGSASKVAPPTRDPLFLALGGIPAERHVLNTVAKIPAAQLHDALLVLPFATLPALLTFIGVWIKKGWNPGLACRVLFFMLRSHQRQIVASRELKGLLEGMKADLRRSLKGLEDLYGFNHAALRYLSEQVGDGDATGFGDADGEESNLKKRAFVDLA